MTKKKLFATWMGYGKRLKHDADSRMRYTIYDMVFEKRKRVPLTKQFIKEAGLDNPGTYEACKLSLKTDFGLHVQEIGSGIEYSRDEEPVEESIETPVEPPKFPSSSKAKAKSKVKVTAKTKDK